jgi:hypothetical protein
VLNDVRREMLLLLKINEFLRNIDRRMGNPVDNFENMLGYIYTELHKFEKEKKSMWEKFMFSMEYYKYVFLFEFFKVYIKINDYFWKDPVKKKEEKNAEIVFEYLH